jgi:hypothetical protein
LAIERGERDVAALHERKRREVAEPGRSFRAEIGRVFVDATRNLPTLSGVPADYARRGQRKDAGCDLLGIHDVDRALGRPLRDHGARRIATMRGQRFDPEWRHNMLMDIDAMSLAHKIPRCSGKWRDDRRRRRVCGVCVWPDQNG